MMNAPDRLLSIVIVNWNSAAYLKKCLASIYRETRDVTFEIVVIDNASFDGCDRLINDEFPDVTFIQLQENTGFAHANNAGAAVAGGSVLCFLNPDTELLGNALKTACDALIAADAGAAGCRLLNSDLSLQTSCVMPFPTIMNQILDLEWLKMKTPRWRCWGISALFAKNTATNPEVEAVSGACMVVRRGVFEDVGGFDEEYFMYSEDVDLCYKMHREGLRTIYCPAAEIVHHGGGSTQGKTPGLFSTAMMREALYRYFEKHRSRGYARRYRFSMLAVAVVRMFVIMLAAPAFVLAGKRGVLAPVVKKWVYVVGWSMGITSGTIGSVREKR
ncbi:MAG: glycosyltransferase family 2 protein [Chitinispirillaceae bacterium]|nr:glycosyltransferase family 2 protein [Chitinispirillaceae bacterium]